MTLVGVIPTVTSFVIVSDISSGSIMKYIWHSSIDFLAFYLTFFSDTILAFYLASISNSYLASSLASILTFSLAFYLAFFVIVYLASLFRPTFFLAPFLAVLLAFYLTYSILAFLSGITWQFWHSFWHGSAHWGLALAVEVRQCPLRSGACGWCPAVLRSGAPAVEVRQCPLRSGAHCWEVEYEEGRRTRRKEGRKQGAWRREVVETVKQFLKIAHLRSVTKHRSWIDCLETDWCRFSFREHGNQIAVSQRVFHATPSAEAHADLHAKRQRNHPATAELRRVPVQDVSPAVERWYGLLCLCRCLICAKVQQTMKTASSDEELAFKQKERDVAMYTRKAGVFIPRPSGRLNCFSR